MALRAITVPDIWVDANFKETQLSRLRIGQTVDLDVDMYGSRKMFKGRISGFTMGTGSTLALLPAENATGNFVKVVQRLPVRIELIDYKPDESPLFVGLSVTPYVYINKEPTGPNAGKVLQPYAPLPKVEATTSPPPTQPPPATIEPPTMPAATRRAAETGATAGKTPMSAVMIGEAAPCTPKGFCPFSPGLLAKGELPWGNVATNHSSTPTGFRPRRASAWRNPVGVEIVARVQTQGRPRLAADPGLEARTPLG